MRLMQIMIASVVLSLSMFTSNAMAAKMSCDVQGHWRDVAYKKAPMDRYESLKSCIAWTAV